jgi:hypothetical protein
LRRSLNGDGHPVAEARAKKRVRTKIGRIIHIPDDATDRSLFNLPVQTNGADGFKLVLVKISEKLKGLAANIFPRAVPSDHLIK